MRALSIYLHVPFCASLCLFCACHTTSSAARAARGLRRRCRGDRPGRRRDRTPPEGQPRPLGRRHAHYPAARSVMAAVMQRLRARFAAAGRRNRGRDRPAHADGRMGRRPRAHRRDAGQPRGAGFRSIGAARDQPRPEPGTDRRGRRAVARGWHRLDQPRPDLRPAASDGDERRADRDRGARAWRPTAPRCSAMPMCRG